MLGHPSSETYFLGRFAPYLERRCLRSLTPWVSRTQKEHVDAILAHKKGVGEINYGLAASQELVLDVLTKWNDHLDDLTGDTPAPDNNVVFLKTA